MPFSGWLVPLAERLTEHRSGFERVVGCPVYPAR